MLDEAVSQTQTYKDPGGPGQNVTEVCPEPSLLRKKRGAFNQIKGSHDSKMFSNEQMLKCKGGK